MHLGYNFLFINNSEGETNGGLYSGIGCGILFNDLFFIKVLYSLNIGSYESYIVSYGEDPADDVSYKYTENYIYTKLSVSAGVSF